MVLQSIKGIEIDANELFSEEYEMLQSIYVEVEPNRKEIRICTM
jgi:hypothetical protein